MTCITLQQNKLFLLLSLTFIGAFCFFGKFNFVFNYTHSLPQKLFIVNVGDKNLKSGDYVVFKAKGLPNTPNGVRIIKKITGVSGDTISRSGNNILINNKYATQIYYSQAFWGAIHPVEDTTIPNECFFLQGTAKTSFDSRYKEFGLICKKQIIGKAYPFF